MQSKVRKRQQHRIFHARDFHRFFSLDLKLSEIREILLSIEFSYQGYLQAGVDRAKILTGFGVLYPVTALCVICP